MISMTHRLTYLVLCSIDRVIERYTIKFGICFVTGILGVTDLSRLEVFLPSGIAVPTNLALLISVGFVALLFW